MDDPFASFGGFDEDSLILNQASAALTDGQIDAACSYFIKIVKESANKINVEFSHSKIAECHYRRERWRDCMESARASLAYSDSKALLALSLYQKDDPHCALDLIDEIEDKDSISKYVQQQLDSTLPDIKELASSKAPNVPKYVEEKVKDLKVLGNYKFKIEDFSGAAKLYRDGIHLLEEWLQKVTDKPLYISNDQVMDQYHKLYGVLLSNQLNCEMRRSNLQECRNLCDKLLEVQPNWKKSYYWSAMGYLACCRYEDARKDFNRCLSCHGSENDNISEKIEFVQFSENHESKFKTMSLVSWQEIFEAHRKNMCWLAGNLFAMSITKIYTDNGTQWHMTTSALIDNSGKITNFMAPRYEASEKDRNLINEMKRNEKRKLYIHLIQNRSDGTQVIGFSDTERLSPIAKDSLSVLEEEVNAKKIFNAFVKNFLK